MMRYHCEMHQSIAKFQFHGSLLVFLEESETARIRDYGFRGNPSVKDAIEALFASTLAVGIALLFTAALLFVSERRPGKKGLNPKNAFAVGIMQAVAVLPGVSRSGATTSGTVSQPSVLKASSVPRPGTSRSSTSESAGRVTGRPCSTRRAGRVYSSRTSTGEKTTPYS